MVDSQSMKTSADAAKEFLFPFKPYRIQEDFMRALYKCIDASQIGLFESPTGTGKSLSLICGTLKWLRDTQVRIKSQLESRISECDAQLVQIERDSDWMAAHSRKQQVAAQRQEACTRLEKVHLFEKRNSDLKESRKTLKLKARTAFRAGKRKNCDGDNKYKDCPSDNDIEDSSKKLRQDIEQLREELDFLIEYDSDRGGEDSDGQDSQKDPLDEDYEDIFPRIYYCSRTHSQLSQFIGEIKRTHYTRETVLEKNKPDLEHLQATSGIVRVSALGSRANLCINPSVASLKNINAMNEKCLEHISSKANVKCEFYKKSRMVSVRDEALSDIQDIEQLYTSGKTHNGCPYFASRYAAMEAEIVVLPYNTLLNERARESFKIRLNPKLDVVIVDEAHNLIETIANIHTIEITLQQLADCYQQLNSYITKYRNRLSPKNTLYVKQVISLISQFIRFMKPRDETDEAEKLWTGSGKVDEFDSRVLEAQNFLVDMSLDHINMFKLLEFCRKSEIARKIYGFTVSKSTANIGAMLENTSLNEGGNKAISAQGGKLNHTTTKPTDNTRPVSSMYQIIELIDCLTHPSADGRLFAFRDKKDLKRSYYKYVPLNPAAQFKHIASNCRSLILAGGTMEPVSDFFNQLFNPLQIPADRIFRFSCGHVIPDNHIKALAIGHSPAGRELEFSYQNRTKTEVMMGAGKILLEASQVIPGGIVCFFVSYDYEDKIYQMWEKAGLIREIETKSKKKVFREPKKANEVSECLEEYTREIRLARVKSLSTASTAATSPLGGAILFSVIGGKMSEGINFGDDLARGVIVFGLPYANIKSPELVEKMKFLSATEPRAGSIYYENQCLKSLNQSIGRAIRHRADYALILLVDLRFANRPALQRALPTWIQPYFSVSPAFATALSQIKSFFSISRTEQ